MTKKLYEYDRNVEYGPASAEDEAAYTEALRRGTPFILKGHHGWEMRFTVRNVPTIEEDKKLYGV